MAFKPRSLKNLMLYDEMPSLSPIVDMKVLDATGTLHRMRRGCFFLSKKTGQPGVFRRDKFPLEDFFPPNRCRIESLINSWLQLVLHPLFFLPVDYPLVN